MAKGNLGNSWIIIVIFKGLYSYLIQNTKVKIQNAKVLFKIIFLTTMITTPACRQDLHNVHKEYFHCDHIVYFVFIVVIFF